MKLITKLLRNEMSTNELKSLSYSQVADLTIKMDLVDKLDTMGVDYGDDFDTVVEMTNTSINNM